MKTTLLTQPFDADNSPVQLGHVLIDLLTSANPFFDRIWIVSAFANQQAVLHLSSHLQSAVSRGANISIVVGFDHQSTSIEALREILSLGIETQVAHNNQPGHTFHPKIYLFEAGDKAELFVGSNNLTEGGLFTNYEASTNITFDFPLDAREYGEFKQSLNRFLNPPDVIVQPLSESLIENLIARGEIISEEQRREAARQTSVPRSKSSDQPIPASLFRNEPIPKPPAKSKRHSTFVHSMPATELRGILVWEKEGLPLTDVQRQEGNPTGGVRLTQAGWKVNDQFVDQTRYFRFNVFNKLKWESGRLRHEDQESAQANFHIMIIGNDYSVHMLKISHKPSGEAGQRNYTTMLHWGELANIIKDLKLGGRTLKLYAPLEGGNIFTIEIT